MPLMTEKELQGHIRKAALESGWLYYHTWLSKFSPAGFPDCVFVKGNRLIFAELKGQTRDPSPKQEEWLETLRQVPGAEVYVWRPGDLEQAYRILLGAELAEER